MREDFVHAVGYHADGDFVLDAPGDDDVCVVALGFDVFVEVGLHEAEPLFHAAFDVTAAVIDVAEDWVRVSSGAERGNAERGLTSSGETHVGVCFGEDLEIEHVQDSIIM